MDAFSSDSVPVHLLTAEAIGDELRTLDGDGTIAFHISNRYYDLAPPIAAAVAVHGLTILERRHAADMSHRSGRAHPRAGSRRPATRARSTELRDRPAGPDGRPGRTVPFTDDYADLLRYLQLGT